MQLGNGHVAVALGILLLAGGVAPSVVAAPGPKVESIVVTPASVMLGAGESADFAAAALDVNGASLGFTDTDFVWTTTCRGGSSITDEGGFTAKVNEEVCFVRAKFEGVVGEAVVNIQLRRLTTIAVTPTATNVPAGSTLQLTATGADQLGGAIAILPAPVWTATCGTVSTTGLFTAPTGVGTCVVTATSALVAGAATLPIVAGDLHHVTFTTSPATTTADATATFVAQARDAHENVRADPIAFSVATGSGAISPAGVFTPEGVGRTTVRASAGAFAKDADIDVTVGSLHHVSFTTAPTTTPADKTAVFVAEARDVRENARTDAIVWSLDTANGAIAAGTFTPALVGDVVVRASVAGTGATATRPISVTVGALDKIAFSQASFSTDADKPIDVSAAAYDARGNKRSDTIAFSKTSGPGTITEAGRYTPGLVGTATIEARAGTVAPATAGIIVTPGSAAGVEFTSAPTATDADTPVRFVARAIDKAGNPTTGAIVFTLTGSGAIDADGLFTPSGAGEQTIVAKTGTISSSFVIRVAAGAPTRVAFTAAPTGTDADTPVTFAAFGYDAKGNAVPTAVVYSATAGTISAEGRYTPGPAKVATITAKLGAFEKTTDITVRPGAVTRITFDEAPVTTPADVPVSFAARAYDAAGNVAGSPAFSIKTGSGSVDAAGRFTPKTVGTDVVLASLGGVTAQAPILVTVGSLAKVVFLTAPLSTDADTPVTFLGQPQDALGNARADAIAYASSSGAAIDATTGKLTPRDATRITVTARATPDVAATTEIQVSPGAIASVAFSAASFSTDADRAIDVAAVALDAKGNRRTDAVAYRVLGSGTVSDAGLFAPLLAGKQTVIASSGGKETTVVVDVVPGAIASVAFTTVPLEMTTDFGTTLAAKAYDAKGNARTDAVSFAVASGLANVDGAGLLLATKTGDVVVKASSGTLTSPLATIRVLPGAPASVAFLANPAKTDADTPVTFRAVVLDAHSNPRTDALTYSMAGSGAIGAASGVFVPDRAERITVSASDGTRVAKSPIDVVAGAPASIVFTSFPSTTSADAPVDLAATALDARGNPTTALVTLTRLSGPGTVDTAGRFTPDRVGASRILATIGKITLEREIATTPGKLATLTAAGPTTLAAGASGTFTLTGRDVHGNDVGYQPATVTLTAPTASGPGTVTYRDPATGIGATSPVGVEPAAIARLVVKGPERAVAGTKAPFSLTGFDAFNNPIPTWTQTIMGDVPTVAGPFTFVAAARDITASTILVAAPAPAVSLSIVPATLSHSADDLTPLAISVTGTDAFGNKFAVPASALQMTALPKGATLVSDKIVPAAIAGAQTLTLSLPGTSATTTLPLVTSPGAIASASLTSPMPRIGVGGVLALSPVFRDAHGNAVPVSRLVWSIEGAAASLDPAAGTIKGVSKGLVLVRVQDAAGLAKASLSVEIVQPEEMVKTADLIIPAPKLAAGEPFVFKVAALDETGGAVPGVKPEFSVEKPEHGTITQEGVFTGDKAGVTDVTAKVGKAKATATVTVIPGALAQIRVTPESASLSLGGSIQFSAKGYDVRRNWVGEIPVTWTVMDATMGSITPEGVYTTGSKVGASHVRASAGAIYREFVVYQFITEVKAPANVQTKIDAITTGATIGDVPTHTHFVGLSEGHKDSVLDVTLPSAKPNEIALNTMSTRLEKAASDVTIMVELQPGSMVVLPEEVDRAQFEERVGAAKDPEPGLFISVLATQQGKRLASADLNALLKSMDITFSVPETYFAERDLDPTQVRLVEWSEGKLVNADVEAKLLTPKPVGGIFRYAATLEQFSAFAFVAKSLPPKASAPAPAAPAPAPPANTGAPSGGPATPIVLHVLPTRIDILGPGEVAVGSSTVYRLVGFTSWGSLATLSQTTLTLAPTAPGDVELRYAEQGIATTRTVRVLAPPDAPASAPGAGANFHVIGFDGAGNPTDLGQQGIGKTAPEGSSIARLWLDGPAQLVAGGRATYLLQGEDATGAPVVFAQRTIDVTAQGLAGSMVIVASAEGSSVSKEILVVPGELARIEVAGETTLPSASTTTFGLRGFDAFGNEVDLQERTLDFVAPPGSRQTYVCYAETGVSGCAEVTVVETVPVAGQAIQEATRGVRLPIPVLGILLVCSLLAIALLVVLARRRNDEDER